MPRKSNTTKKSPRYLWLAVTTFLVLFGSYTINLFGLWSYFYSFQKDSESLVVNQLECRYIHGQDQFGGMLVSLKREPPPANFSAAYKNCSKDVFEAYFPQFNLEGHFISLFAPQNEHQLTNYLRIWKVVIVSFLAASMAYFVVLVAREFSLTTALTLLGGLAISTWMVFIARNLYWVPFLTFLPLVFSFGFYQKLKDRGKTKLFYAILGGLFFIKALAGYEFITCVILASFAPILYYEVKSAKKIEYKKLLRSLGYIVGVGIIGFLLAFTLNFFQLELYFHSPSEAISALQTRAFDRTLSATDVPTTDLLSQANFLSPEIYKLMHGIFHLPGFGPGQHFYGLAVNIFDIVFYLAAGIYGLPINLPPYLTLFVQSVAATIVISGLTIWIWRKNKLLKSSPKHLALSATLVFSFLSSISWFIFAHPHTLHHPHLDPFVYYLPYALIFYILLGVVIDAAINKLLKRR